ncbi:5'-methylthioadenosine/S-adenosylhomocysteine nucleosidase [Salinibacillus xinjiangensis]|uniref:5'-methylthioadenosine/S-adenosylhomocysteine nucleosidase n=1 Tax=Salinibacillus xinjiangensis TaxID=1229268 RepID=A0A6G1X795_9BACI|nr:5'-methylthioadenosine/S-adenosylhomocysteine nucleosidase [Salinibacillus xinjiangensis]MRG86678.1 5'-methylthioadenosine/S-adenosylhomocysteine nucleosidase [Salinibacillus xinjiangensis]
MTVGIIGAMDEEIELIKSKMTIEYEEKVAGSLFYQGQLHGIQVVLLKSGIGKVNAAMSTTILMERYQPEYIINTGSAGGFAKQLEVGDIVISDRIVHHDVDVTAFNYDYGQVPQLPTYFEADENLISLAIKAAESLPDVQTVKGLIATGDSFMDDAERVQFVRERFPKIEASEMEAAAIAQVSHQYQVPFVIIRSLSDIAGKDSSVSFDQYLDKAAKHAATLIMNIIDQLS